VDKDDEEIKYGELFCDKCGDCYHCFADDPCIDDEGHYFIFNELKKENK
jgi:hypothetical protein